MVASFQAVAETMELHAFSPRLFAAAGDDISTVLDVDITVRPTGKRIDFDEVHECTVRDGRVVRDRPHLDPVQIVDAYTLAT